MLRNIVRIIDHNGAQVLVFRFVVISLVECRPGIVLAFQVRDLRERERIDREGACGEEMG